MIKAIRVLQISMIACLLFGCSRDIFINDPIDIYESTQMNATISPISSTIPIDLLDEHYQTSNEFVHDLFSREICNLPCVGEIYPGQTDINDVKRVYQEFGAEYLEDYQNNSVGFVFNSSEQLFNGNRLWIGIRNGIMGDHEIVNYIELFRYDTSIKSILKENGIPQNIYIKYIESLPGDEDTPVSLLLDYSNNGVIFHFYQSIPNAIPIEVCSNMIDNKAHIIVWDLNIGNNVMEIINKYSIITDVTKSYNNLSDISNIAIDDFYELYSKESLNNPCFTIHSP